MEVRVKGADELNRLARNLKGADKAVRRELYAGLQRATKPMRANAKRAAATRLPQRGGLAAEVARSRFSARIKTANRNTRLRIEVSSRKGADLDLRALDRGRIRHPVFGRRGAWVTQEITPEIISGSLANDAPIAQREALAALDRVARQMGT